MKYCKNCGAQVSDDAEFCANCGESVKTISEVVNADVAYSNHHIKERNIIVAVILSLVTCGIYSIYWMIKVNDEALELSGESGNSGIVVLLLNLVTCGIYGLFWAYKMGTCSDKIKNIPNGNSNVLYLIISLLGLGIVNIILTQDAINNKVK